MIANAMNEKTVHKAQHIRKLIVNIVTKGGHDVKVSLPSLLSEAMECRLWEALEKPDGTKYANIIEWLEDGLPNGCLVGLENQFFNGKELADMIRHYGTNEARDALAEALSKASRKRGGDRRSAAAKKNQTTAPAFDRQTSPYRADVLEVRLREEHPDHWQAFLDGKHKSVTAAAVAAGICQPRHDPLRCLKQYWRKATEEQREEFRKWLKTKESRE